jgi:hypothetical protein
MKGQRAPASGTISRPRCGHCRTCPVPSLFRQTLNDSGKQRESTNGAIAADAASPQVRLLLPEVRAVLVQAAWPTVESERTTVKADPGQTNRSESERIGARASDRGKTIATMIRNSSSHQCRYASLETATCRIRWMSQRYFAARRSYIFKTARIKRSVRADSLGVRSRRVTGYANGCGLRSMGRMGQ